jgi:hypothetical protein
VPDDLPSMIMHSFAFCWTPMPKKPLVELILQDPTRMKRSLITVCRKRFHCNQRWESIANKEISKIRNTAKSSFLKLILLTFAKS